MSDVLVKIDNVSKRFCRSLKRSLWYGLQDLGSEIGGRRHGGESGLPQSSADVQLRPDEFWAVKDVSFELRRGECLGLIGRNGAGKTTLLRMLNGLIKPDTGRIEMKGNVGALIALGAGFNPLLTGRENLKIACSINGLANKDLSKAIDQITDFADLHDFIDSPLQSYSSGMAVRLGFSTAIFLTPDILIIDEVLAVGDIDFRVKCYNLIRDRLSKTAVILVSHNTFDIQKVCTNAMLLNNGQVDHFGKKEFVLKEYLAAAKNKQPTELSYTGDGKIDGVVLQSAIVDYTHILPKALICLKFFCSIDLECVVVRCVFFLQSGEIVAEWCSSDYFIQYSLKEGVNRLDVCIKDLRLTSSLYDVVLVITDSSRVGYYLRINTGITLDVRTSRVGLPAYRI